MLEAVHHIAIICSDYERSKAFYTQKLGFTILREVFRKERQSYKLDLALNGHYLLELFSFPNAPARLSRPEACGLRHLAFQVKNLEEVLEKLKSKQLQFESVRTDEFTGKRFTFLFDPDQLPIELYEV